ncbi:MAG: hypothetical protein K2M63_10515 [Muribaculaceae bacterium]|nr:hypothetical protein [Muribaculaceae bacterium]
MASIEKERMRRRKKEMKEVVATLEEEREEAEFDIRKSFVRIKEKVDYKRGFQAQMNKRGEGVIDFNVL